VAAITVGRFEVAVYFFVGPFAPGHPRRGRWEELTQEAGKNYLKTKESFRPYFVATDEKKRGATAAPEKKGGGTWKKGGQVEKRGWGPGQGQDQKKKKKKQKGFAGPRKKIPGFFG